MYAIVAISVSVRKDFSKKVKGWRLRSERNILLLLFWKSSLAVVCVRCHAEHLE